MKTTDLKTVLAVLALMLAGIGRPLPAAEAPSAVLLFADGFEKLIPGDELAGIGNDDWLCREKSKVTVIDDPRNAAAGKQFLYAVATGERLPEKVGAFFKIPERVAEGGLHRSLAALGLDPGRLQGQVLHFSIKARGKGYLQFYLYRYGANGGGVGNGANPYSPITRVASAWSEIAWTYQVPVEADVAAYRVAIHFFTGDDRGIDLDDFKLDLLKK